MEIYDVTKWFSLWWYRYLFDGCTGWRNFWCRARGHRPVVWYTLSSMEPDMHCSHCDEDLG